MKIHKALLATLALSAASLFASSGTPPELRGVLSLGGVERFSMSTVGGTETAWVAVGGSFDGWHVDSYDKASETLTVTCEGVTKTLKLLSSAVKQGEAGATKATLADAEAIIRKMNFEALMRKTIEQQKKMSVQMAKQMAAQAGTQVDEADLAAFQQKVMDVMFNDETIKAMSDDMTRIYADVFTAEELQGLSDFYSTSAGQAMIDKTPAVQEQLMQAMMPRMMANMAKVRELGMEFGREQQAKAAAAKAAQEAAAAAPAEAKPAE